MSVQVKYTGGEFKEKDTTECLRPLKLTEYTLTQLDLDQPYYHTTALVLDATLPLL